MKNGNLIFRTLIALAVVALFVLHFMDDKPSSQRSSSSNTSASQGGHSNIAFVRLDSINKSWEYQKQMDMLIREQKARMEGSLQYEAQQFSDDLQFFQQNAGSFTAVERTRMRNDLEARQRNLEGRAMRGQQEFQSKQDSISQFIQLAMDDVTAQLQEQYGFDYLIQYELALFYGDSTRDLSSDMVRLLNEKYPPQDTSNENE